MTAFTFETYTDAEQTAEARTHPSAHRLRRVASAVTHIASRHFGVPNTPMGAPTVVPDFERTHYTPADYEAMMTREGHGGEYLPADIAFGD